MTANTAFGVSTPINSRSLNNAFDAVLNNGFDFSNIVATGSITAASFSGALNANNLTSGTVPSARISGSYTGITGVGTLTVGSIPASLLTGTTLPSSIVTSSLTSVGTITSGTWSGSFGAVSGANLTSLNASNLSSGTVASARISGAYTGFTSITVDGASSAAFTLGDWGPNGNYGGIIGNMGYLLAGNNSGDTAMYLRTSTAGAVNIGANGSNTLAVGNGTVTQAGNTTLTANNTYQCAALPAFGFNAWAGVSSYNFYNASDIRYKANIKELPLGLEFIKLLDAIEFTYLYPEFGDESGTPTSIVEGTRLRAGLSAQNVKQALDAVNAGDYNLWALANKDDEDSFQAIDYTGLIAPLIKAVQELEQRLTELETA
jgi:hypothetical protein